MTTGFTEEGAGLGLASYGPLLYHDCPLLSVELWPICEVVVTFPASWSGPVSYRPEVAHDEASVMQVGGPCVH